MKTTFHAFFAVLCLGLIILAAISCTQATPTPPPAPTAVSTSAPGGETGWEKRWNEVLAGAKAEGSLTIYGASGPEMRQATGQAFLKKYGIQIEWVFARVNEVVQRAMTERRAGIYNADVFIDGATSIIDTLMATGGFKPIGQDLILPEVTDGSKWYWGKVKWFDDEKTHVIYAAFPEAPFEINTDIVKKNEIQSYRDLLDPKWKDKITMDDPTVAGSGNGWATSVGSKIMGDDFLWQFARQKPMISRDRRQEIEWLAKGKYHVLAGASMPEYTEFKRMGAPVEVLVPKEGTWLTQSRGSMSLMNNAPHPNAAIVYLNWALSKEGQEVICRSEGFQSGRTDVPTDFLEPYAVRQPGVTYHDNISLEYQKLRLQYLDTAKQIFGDLIK